MKVLLGVSLCFTLALGRTEHPPPQPATTTQRKPKVSLTALPRITTADTVNGRLITATLIIKDADERLWCPEVEWEWNGQHSSQTSDCPPFEQSEAGERALWVQTRQRRFFGRGVVSIVVRLMKGGKVIRRVETEVSVQ